MYHTPLYRSHPVAQFRGQAGVQMLSWRLVTNLFGNDFLYFQKVKALARLVSAGEECPKVPILMLWGVGRQGAARQAVRSRVGGQ